MTLPELASSDMLPEGLDQAAIDAASTAIRTYCGWHIAPPVTQTLTLDGNGALSILLPSLHVTAITALTIDGTVVDVSTLEWSEAGYLRVACGSRKLRGVVVTITHGWPECPADVASVLASFATRGVTASNIQQQVAGSFSVTYTPGGAVGPVTIGSDASTLGFYKLPPRP